MAIPWDQVLPKEEVARIKRELTKKNAFFLRANATVKPGSKQAAYRSKINIRYEGGFVSPDGSKFYDRDRKRWISLNRAILEEKITFELAPSIGEGLFKHLSQKEHGFMLALIPLLSEFEPTSDNEDNNKSIKNRLNWLTYSHQWSVQRVPNPRKPGETVLEGVRGVSRNFIDPFFHSVLGKLEEKLKKKAQEFLNEYGGTKE